MSERLGVRKFASPDEEIAYLREEIAKKERELVSRSSEVDQADIETLGKATLREYAEHTVDAVLPESRHLPSHVEQGLVSHVSEAKNKVEEILHIAEEYGIRNVLAVLEKAGDSFIIDEAHRALVEHVHSGRKVANLKEGAPSWNLLHMKLFSISLPEFSRESDEKKELAAIISATEQLFSGLQTINGGRTKESFHYSIEIAIADNSDDIVFYVAVPSQFEALFEKQLLSLFPRAVVTEEQKDYNIFVRSGESLIAVGTHKKHSIYPIRTYESFDHDPLQIILNAFSKIEREGGGASLQFLIRPKHGSHRTTYDDIIKRVEKGMSATKAIELSTTMGSITNFIKDEFLKGKKKDDETKPLPPLETDKLELFREKIQRPIDEVAIRIAVSANNGPRANQILQEIEAAFNQFENTMGNAITFKELRGSARAHEIQLFAFREFNERYIMPLSERELATMIHLPEVGAKLSSQYKQTQAVGAPAPQGLPSEGTLLGINRHRGSETKVYITAEDRLRHFYIIGQTGTGKTTLMKNMIVQDIQSGAGVCFIDPHGSDIQDILGSIPESREQDVIYFDPAHLDRVMGLNMLEFDPRYPEQKTFVVNELFSIFQKLYGANPESMGPMFEQYFRNATSLVLEDPESGSTLLDVSRVMVDAAYRRQKLMRAKNPVVVQFWREIATKAGGEAALENIVPYITSKFDVFTANDYMRPIIGQQRSAFNFRELMDTKKILLVNLSKGRLGEINANLIGMIIVGKILMAALSRADSPGKLFPEFYLHVDEFQNITTNTIASILSEARKYRLGLTIAHQYIEQIDEKIRDAVFGNVGSMAAFRVGPEDAEFLEKQLAPTFTKNDLLYIPNRHAYLRLLANGTPTRPFDIETLAPQASDKVRAALQIELSRVQYGRPHAEVEVEIAARYQRERNISPQ